MGLNSEIKIINELINNSEQNYELLINGFYNEILSEKSYRKLFSQKQVPKRADFAHYKIDLNENNIRILNEILNEEGANFINDITHFAIKTNGEFSAISYDSFSLIQVNKKLFKTDLKTLNQYCDDEIEINFMDNLDDNGFFNWSAEKPAHNN